MARTKTEAAKSKVETAGSLASIGSTIGSVGGPVGRAVGGGLGAITGLIIGDENIVFPLDMVAIPAYQAYLIQGTPSLQIYIRAGESLVPTGGNVRDVEEVMQSDVIADTMLDKGTNPRGRKRAITAYQRRYKAAFKKVKGQYKKKDGTWKKNGFKAAVKAAHKIAGGKK